MTMHPRAEAVRQFQGPVHRAVDHMDLPKVAFPQRLDDGPARAAGTQDDRPSGVAIPSRMAVVEIGKEANTVGIGRHQPAVLAPERVGGAEFIGQGIRHVGKPIGRFLVRNGDIAAAQAKRATLEIDDEACKRFRCHLDLLVAAGNAHCPQPMTVDQRRAGMLDREAHDEGVMVNCFT